MIIFCVTLGLQFQPLLLSPLILYDLWSPSQAGLEHIHKLSTNAFRGPTSLSKVRAGSKRPSLSHIRAKQQPAKPTMSQGLIGFIPSPSSEAAYLEELITFDSILARSVRYKVLCGHSISRKPNPEP